MIKPFWMKDISRIFFQNMIKESPVGKLQKKNETGHNSTFEKEGLKTFFLEYEKNKPLLFGC